MKPRPAVESIGERFGRLVVQSIHRGPAPFYQSMAACQCDCGKTSTTTISKLRSGHTTSCGCRRGETLIRAITRHGMTYTSEYRTWCQIIARTTNPKHPRWKDYGGRGIVMDPRWRSTFEAFYADIGPRPKGLTLDRINNDGPYAPDNVRWATQQEQNRNRRDNHREEFQGEKLTITEWAFRFGIRVGTLWLRLNRGWSIEKALTTPLKGSTP